MEPGYLEKHLRGLFDAFEVCFLKEGKRKYEAVERELGGAEFLEEEGIALRAIKDGTMVFSYTFEKGEAALKDLMENARLLLPFADHDTDYGFAEPSGAYPALDGLYDEEGRATTGAVKADMILALEGAILDYDKRIVKTRNCELNEVEIEVRLINSKGMEATARKTMYLLGAMAMAADTEDVSWYDWSWSHSLSDLDPRGLGLKIAEKAVSLLSPRPLNTGIYNGLLTPGAACEILGILSSSFLSENLMKNKTWLKDRVGQACFSSVLTITDSGFKGLGSLPFDGEGVPSRENVLVRDGRFEGFLYDLYYGKKLGHASTGNSVRIGVKETPRCGARGLLIEPGYLDLADEFTDGVIIEDLMGTHTANPVTGDFSLGATGFRVEKGERIPFKGVMFSGNIFELLKDVRAVGKDMVFYGTCGSPTLLVQGLKISGE